MSAHAQFAIFRRRFQIQIAGEFVIQGKVADVNHGIDHGSIERPGALQRKVGATVHRQFVQMNLANPRQIEILPDQVKSEAACRRRVGSAAGDSGVFVSEVNIAESGFVRTNVKIGIELLDRLSVGRGIGGVNVSLHLRMRARSR